MNLSHQIIEHKNAHDICVGNPGPGLGQAQNVTGLNWFVEFQPSPFDN
jgi:hypothetical protein